MLSPVLFESKLLKHPALLDGLEKFSYNYLKLSEVFPNQSFSNSCSEMTMEGNGAYLY